MKFVMPVSLFSLPVAVAITVIASSGIVSAADQPIAAGPAYIGAPAAGCATCNGNGAAAPCDSCGKPRFSIFHHQKSCKPYQTQLCPGACFGYFQTQWHKWENVCPIPYQGVGLNDAPVRPAPPVVTPGAPKTSGSDLPIPKSLLPKVPTVPGK